MSKTKQIILFLLIASIFCFSLSLKIHLDRKREEEERLKNRDPFYFHPVYSEYGICNTSEPEIILNNKNICYNKNIKTLFFIHVSTWNDLDACAVTTSALKNPDYGVCVLQEKGIILKKTYLNKWSQLGNIEVRTLEPDKLLKDTPMFNWFKSTCATPGNRVIVIHVSDALRFAYLYKFGGVYLDTDVLTLKPFGNLTNVMSWYQVGVQLNNAVMLFEKENPFIREVIERLPLRAQVDNWFATGPSLLNHVYEERTKRLGDRDIADGILKLYPPYLFYPFNGTELNPFKAASGNILSIMAEDSITIHLHRGLYPHYWKGNEKMDMDSFVGKIYFKYCV